MVDFFDIGCGNLDDDCRSLEMSKLFSVLVSLGKKLGNFSADG